MTSIPGNVLLGAKWVTCTLLCGANYQRYMGVRAAAVRLAARRQWYERRQVRFLRSWLRAGDAAADVGANLGAYTINLAEAVGPSGTVVAFGPLTETFEWLRRSTARYPQVSCLNTALSDRPAASLEIFVPLLFGRIPEPSLAGLADPSARCDRRTVQVVTLDDYLHRFQRLSSIKIDDEGYELAVLEGARRTLERYRPLVQLEANDIASQYEGFNRFAKSLGFSVCSLDAGGQLRELTAASTAPGYNFYLRPDDFAERI